MYSNFGIKTKLFSWYFILVSIFYGTIFILFIHMSQIMKVSDRIVNEEYKLDSLSKRMLEQLLALLENEKKYRLLWKPEYVDLYVAAKQEFEQDLAEVANWHTGGQKDDIWPQLYREYQNYKGRGRLDPARLYGDQFREEPWIPTKVVERWIRVISTTRLENQMQVEREVTGLHQRGLMAARWGLVGLGASIVVGLLAALFLTYSMSRPLRELRRGIRSISREGLTKPIRINSKDEFGELALAINDMARRLREEERMRSNFISMLSHEIRTPLTSIRESVNLVMEEVTGAVNPRQRRLLEIASREMKRLTDLLNHLMQTSRLEASVLDIHPLATDTSTLVSISLNRLAPMAEAKGIKIDTRVPEGIPAVLGDPEHLQQVLVNLVGNAIKFSPPGEEVVVRVENRRDRKMLRFSVSDQGPGIPEEERMMVFTRYYRVAGTREHVDGLGLGLSISKQIVNAHGGSIWLESRVGRGSTFYFTLPVAKEG